MIKSDIQINTLTLLQKISISVLFQFYSSKDHEESITASTKIFSSSTVFNIDNTIPIFFVVHFIVFLKDHVTLKTHSDSEVMMLKIQLCHHRNKLYFKIYQVDIYVIYDICYQVVILNCNNISQYYRFTALLTK